MSLDNAVDAGITGTGRTMAACVGALAKDGPAGSEDHFSLLQVFILYITLRTAL